MKKNNINGNKIIKKRRIKNAQKIKKYTFLLFSKLNR